jgi:hypothetical protein
MYETWMGAGRIAKISFLAPCIFKPNEEVTKYPILQNYKDIKVHHEMRNSWKGFNLHEMNKERNCSRENYLSVAIEIDKNLNLIITDQVSNGI